MPTVATTAATVVTWAIAIGIIVIGARGLWIPHAPAGFGIPGTRTDDPPFRAWLTVKANRDIGTGIFLLIALLGAGTQLYGWMMLAGSLMPLADAIIVKRSGGPAAVSYGVHGGTAAVMAVAGAVLLLS